MRIHWLVFADQQKTIPRNHGLLFIERYKSDPHEIQEGEYVRKTNESAREESSQT